MGRRARTEAGGGAEEGAEDGVVVGGDVRAVDAARLDRVVLVRVEHRSGAPANASAHSHLASAAAWSCYLPTSLRRLVAGGGSENLGRGCSREPGEEMGRTGPADLVRSMFSCSHSGVRRECQPSVTNSDSSISSDLT